MLVLAEWIVRACACAGFQTGAPKVLPGQLDAGKTLPNQVQAMAKEEWADAMSAAAAAAQHARRAQDASDAAERFARNSNSSAPAAVSRKSVPGLSGRCQPYSPCVSLSCWLCLGAASDRAAAHSTEQRTLPLAASPTLGCIRSALQTLRTRRCREAAEARQPAHLGHQLQQTKPQICRPCHQRYSCSPLADFLSSAHYPGLCMLHGDQHVAWTEPLAVAGPIMKVKCAMQAPARSGQGSPQRFVKRSDSEIQRAYDAAVGPPAKKDGAGPPSAPPAPPPSVPRPASPSLPSPPPSGEDIFRRCICWRI